LRVLQ